MNVPFDATLTVPWLGAVFDVTVRPVPTSLVRTDEPFRVVLTGVATLSLNVTGPTVMLTVAVVVCPDASVAVYVKASRPE